MHDMRVWLRLFEAVEPQQIGENAPEGWEGTVKAMKKEKDIDNPWALSHWMKNKGYHSHKKESMEFLRDLSGAMVTEKWDTDYETPKSKQGMWDGWSKSDLEAERNKLRDKEERTDADSTRLKQVNFALRAKSGWGDVPD